MRKKGIITMAVRESATDAFGRFLLAKRANGVKTKTIESYSQHFHAISKHLFVRQEMAGMTAEDLRNMVISMQESGLSPNSIKSYTITLKAFLSWCNAEGITSLNMAKYKGEETIKETYSDEELSKLLQKPDMKKCSFAEYRSWVIVNLLVNCGCRAATIRNILIRDVDLPSRVIQARHTKNRKALVIPLCSQMVGVLREYLNIRGGEANDFLFCTEHGTQLTENALRCSIADYNTRRGVGKTSIHLFRHTFARKYLVDCGGNAFALQRLLGHATLDMTKHYCEIYDTDLTKNFDKYSSLAQMKAGGEKIKVRQGWR